MQKPSPLRFGAVCVLGMLALAGLSCSSLTAPAATPNLQQLHARTLPSLSGVFVVVSGIVAEGHQVREGEAIKVHLRNSRGDSTEVGLERSLCGSSPLGMYRCRGLSVTLAPGRHPSELGELLRRLDAGFVRTWDLPGGMVFGSIEVFSGSVDRALDQLRRHPAIETAERVGGAIVAEVGAGQELSRHLEVVIPTRPSDPDLPSATFPVRSGDELIATYIQPDGSRLVAHARVP